MSDYFPVEIWPEIFKKATPETLFRCRCVCKSWNTLISSTRFIAAHAAAQIHHLIIKETAQQTPPEPENYVVFCPKTRPRCDDVRIQADSHSFHIQADSHSFRIVGTVNGVICLADESVGTTHQVVLWNPTIGIIICPPNATHTSLELGYSSTIGFGFDPSKNELKVVRIARALRAGSGQLPPKVEVYSVRGGSWKAVGYDVVNCHLFHNRWSQCLVGGAAHWPAFVRARRNVLLAFHFEKEVFKIIEVPREVEVLGSSVSKLGCLLSVLQYKREAGAAWRHGCDVWAMQEYGEVSSWCKMVSVEWGGDGLRNVVWVREDAGEVIVSTASGELMRYDTRIQEAQPIGIRCKGDGFFADGFVRSLVLLDV